MLFINSSFVILSYSNVSIISLIKGKFFLTFFKSIKQFYFYIVRKKPFNKIDKKNKKENSKKIDESM